VKPTCIRWTYLGHPPEVNPAAALRSADQEATEPLDVQDVAAMGGGQPRGETP